jgi:uncharacterized repeat protein (TIGR03803 family)
MMQYNPPAASGRYARALFSAALWGGAGIIASSAEAAPARVLHAFRGTPDGNYPSNRFFAVAGALYGVTAYGGTACLASSTGCGTVFEIVPSPHGTAQKLLYRFQGPPNDGAVPGSGTLTADASGALYGTTISGGSGTCNYFGVPGCGVVFKLTPTATGYKESVVYNFQGGKKDGSNPVYGVVADAYGNLYGTTSAGGSDKCPGGGCGVAYKLTLTPNGYAESVIFRFSGVDGAYPDATPIIDAAGVLYGTTFDGGTGACATYGGGCGLVYSLTPAGTKYTRAVLYDFQGGADGVQVQSGLLADGQGALYGMTTYGGTGPCSVAGLPPGCGTIFKLAPSAAGYAKSTLYNFQGSDGSLPTGSLYRGPNGSLYGSTPFGGAGACNDYGITGCGLVFALIKSKSGYAEKVLYDFAATKYEGIYPNDPLIDGGSIYISTCCGSHDQYGALDAIKLPSGF